MNLELQDFLGLIIIALVFLGLLLILADSSYKQKQLEDFCIEEFGFTSNPFYKDTFWFPDSCTDINGIPKVVEYYKGNWII